MIGSLKFKGQDGEATMNIWGVESLAQLQTLATSLQSYTNAAIIGASIWLAQDLPTMPDAREQMGFDLVDSKSIIEFNRTNAPAGKPPRSRINYPAPRADMFEQLPSKPGRSKNGGWRVKTGIGNFIASTITNNTNRVLAFSRGWFKAGRR
jgi:hypothetical protein